MGLKILIKCPQCKKLAGMVYDDIQVRALCPRCGAWTGVINPRQYPRLDCLGLKTDWYSS